MVDVRSARIDRERVGHRARLERRQLERQHELLELQRCASRSKLAAARACTPGESAVLLHVSAQDEATVRCSACRWTRTQGELSSPGGSPFTVAVHAAEMCATKSNQPDLIAQCHRRAPLRPHCIAKSVALFKRVLN